MCELMESVFSASNMIKAGTVVEVGDRITYEIDGRRNRRGKGWVSVRVPGGEWIHEVSTHKLGCVAPALPIGEIWVTCGTGSLKQI